MKYLFSFLCLCCVLSVSAQKPVVINLAKAISESPKEIMLNELASDIRYVPLETTDDCLMNNEFYIMQYTGEDIITSGIFHFDKNGKFLNKRSIMPVDSCKIKKSVIQPVSCLREKRNWMSC